MSTITVTRVRPPGIDPKTGDPIDGTAGTLDIPGCSLAPRSSNEGTERGREGVVTGLTLYAPAGADILHTDQIRVPGEPKPWEIDGEVGDWSSRFTTWHPGLVVALRRATG